MHLQPQSPPAAAFARSLSELVGAGMGLWKRLNVTVLDQLEEELHLLLIILNGDSLIQPMDPERKRMFFSPGGISDPTAPCLAVDFIKQCTTGKQHCKPKTAL